MKIYHLPNRKAFQELDAGGAFETPEARVDFLRGMVGSSASTVAMVQETPLVIRRHFVRKSVHARPSLASISARFSLGECVFRYGAAEPHHYSVRAQGATEVGVYSHEP